MAWLLIVALPAAVAILLGRALRIRRFSRSHIVAQLTVGGRGVYFSHTADGSW
jgi:hypothetical protein